MRRVGCRHTSENLTIGKYLSIKGLRSISLRMSEYFTVSETRFVDYQGFMTGTARAIVSLRCRCSARGSNLRTSQAHTSGRQYVGLPTARSISAYRANRPTTARTGLDRLSGSGNLAGTGIGLLGDSAWSGMTALHNQMALAGFWDYRAGCKAEQ